MGFLQLKSNNPKFSYILKKNPDSGMIIKSSRKGRLFAWYTDSNIFNIYFRDSDTDVSCARIGAEFEYMDVTRYNSPLFVINAFQEFLRHMKDENKDDLAGYENSLMINQIKCKRYNIEEFKTHFKDYEFIVEEVAYRNYRMEIKTKNTLRELVNLGQIFAIFNALTNKDISYINDSDIDRYISCLKVVDSPYYIRHLFSVYFLTTQRLFMKYKTLLEKSNKAKIEIEFGNTLAQRMDAIGKRLDFTIPIVDIGCGEGNYVREFASKLDNKGLKYHAIDIDPARIELVQKFCKREGLENVTTWSSVNEFLSSNNFPSNSNILMTEVIEHMSKEDAKALLNKILGCPFKSLIITTPNKEFNINYQVDDLRNIDHIFEMTKEEFTIWINEIINGNGKNMNIEFFDIGDSVNNLRSTLAVVVKKKL
jgi:2-polyprenyl-3-methyl-5-hydroxy-6-metoxy-1,4-benzoquinol methylase